MPILDSEQRGFAKAFRRRADFFPVFTCLADTPSVSALPERRLRLASRLNLKTSIPSIPSIRWFWDAWDGWDGEFRV